MLALAFLAALADSAASFSGTVVRQERFTQPFGDRYIFELAPDDLGWTIVVRDRERPEDDLASITPPFHGINGRDVEGWFFRNADNTGPNLPDERNVNAPMEEHPFYFSPWAGIAIHDPWTWGNYLTQDPEGGLYRILQDGSGTLRVKEIALGNLVPGEEAWIERMTFEVDLRWRPAAVDTSLDSVEALTRAVDYAKRIAPARLDTGLADTARVGGPLEEWLIGLADTESISWEANDCGEFAGDPSIDSGRPRWVCVEASATLADGRRVVLRLFVGTVEQGIHAPVLQDAWVEIGADRASARSLSDLERLLRDPYRAVLRFTPYTTGLERFYLDLDDDGQGDLFLAASSNRGTGGNGFHVHLIRPDGYRYLGEIPVGSIETLSTGSNGLRDLRAGWRMGGGEYTITIFRFDGRRYVAEGVRTVRLDPETSELPSDYPRGPSLERSYDENAWSPEDD